MTIEQKESLERELKGAMESGDAARIRCAHSNIMLAVMDCQQKSGDRIKEVDRRVRSIGWRMNLLIFAVSSGGGYAAANWQTILKFIIGG